MKLDVLKNSQNITSLDLSDEIKGLEREEVSFYLGRSDDCHIQLDDKLVSREHALITYSQGTWSIERCTEHGSLRVNGALIEKKELFEGDSVEVGPFVVSISGLKRTPQSQSDGKANEQSTDEPNVEQESVTETQYTPSEDEEEAQEQETASEEFDHDGESEASEDDEAFDSSDDDFNAPDGGEGLEEPAPDFTSSDFGEVDADQSPGPDEPDDEFGFENESVDDEDGFSDDFGVATTDDEGTQVIQAFAKFELEIFGEYAPFDKYLIDKKEVIIGRDPEKCDIVLNDPEVSSTHAAIKKSNIDCVLEDLKSGNGTLLNGARINSSSLSASDEFIIGSTTFTVNVGSDLISQQEDKLMPVDENQEVEVEEVVEVDADFGDDDLDEDSSAEESGDFGKTDAKPKNQSLFSKEALQDPERRKKLLIIAVVILGLFVLLEDPESEDEATTAQQEEQERERRASRSEEPSQEEGQQEGQQEAELTTEEKEQAESIYQLAREFFDQGRYSETIFELQKLFAITDDYKNARQIDSLAKQGLARLEEIEREKRREIERQERQEKIEDLVERAKEAVEKRRVEAAESYFVQILELDPQNFEVPQLKIELESWQKEQERIAMEEAEEKARRRRMERELEPGRNLYSRQEWYRAIHELEEYLSKEDIDDDLRKEARDMLEESKERLKNITEPLLGRARSLREGRDLKGAYEAYKEVLQFYPTHQEAINEMTSIEDTLYLRSRRIYREALIDESLSLFDSAREKFEEVQQISPSDSEYYIKATERLREYLD